jgi:hypothetical protein
VIRAAMWFAIALCLASCANLGELCQQDDDCGDELICHRPELDDGGLAAEGVCSYPLLARGAVCAVTDECGANLFCSNDLPAEVKQRFGRCVDAQPSGAACSRDENCASGLVCGIAEGAETGNCAAAPAERTSLAPLDER